MSFTCPVCGMTSHHPEDEKYGYCGNCHAFTRDMFGTHCPLCNELILPADETRPCNGLERGMHRECGLRSVVGSIEHLEMGPHPVGSCNEHDRGLSYRENAKLVDEWIAKHGIEAAFSSDRR